MDGDCEAFPALQKIRGRPCGRPLSQSLLLVSGAVPFRTVPLYGPVYCSGLFEHAIVSPAEFLDAPHHRNGAHAGCATCRCEDGSGGNNVRPRIRSAAFSAIMITQALMFAPTMSGSTDPSTIRNRSTPRSRNCVSTTAWSSLPIRHVL